MFESDNLTGTERIPR